MPLSANNPDRRTWLPVPENSDFPIQNIPFGVFLTRDDVITIGTRIGDTAIDLGALHQLGYFDGIELTDDIFLQDSLNDFIADGRKTWRRVRNRISEIFMEDNASLRDNEEHRHRVLFAMDEIEMQVPVDVGDYTDFYASKEHATNVGSLFRDPENALLPNWLRIPIGYHGRASSIEVSGRFAFAELRFVGRQQCVDEILVLVFRHRAVQVGRAFFLVAVGVLVVETYLHFHQVETVE